MPAKQAERLQISGAAELHAYLVDVRDALQEPETEASWQRLDRALLRLELITKSGGYKFDEFVPQIKAMAAPINNSLLSDRTKLSGTAADLLNSVAPRLAERFDALVTTFVPSLLLLCARTNKVALSRAKKCLLLIIKHCRLPSMLPLLRDATRDKAPSLRGVALECVAALLEAAEPARIGKRVADVELAVKSGATDSSPEVRQWSKRAFELYVAAWPERVECFTAPLTPTIRRYLSLPKSGPLLVAAGSKATATNGHGTHAPTAGPTQRNHATAPHHPATDHKKSVSGSSFAGRVALSQAAASARRVDRPVETAPPTDRLAASTSSLPPNLAEGGNTLSRSLSKTSAHPTTLAKSSFSIASGLNFGSAPFMAAAYAHSFGANAHGSRSRTQSTATKVVDVERRATAREKRPVDPHPTSAHEATLQGEAGASSQSHRRADGPTPSSRDAPNAKDGVLRRTASVDEKPTTPPLQGFDAAPTTTNTHSSAPVPAAGTAPSDSVAERLAQALSAYKRKEEERHRHRLAAALAVAHEGGSAAASSELQQTSERMQQQHQQTAKQVKASRVVLPVPPPTVARQPSATRVTRALPKNPSAERLEALGEQDTPLSDGRHRKPTREMDSQHGVATHTSHVVATEEKAAPTQCIEPNAGGLDGVGRGQGEGGEGERAATTNAAEQPSSANRENLIAAGEQDASSAAAPPAQMKDASHPYALDEKPKAAAHGQQVNHQSADGVTKPETANRPTTEGPTAKSKAVPASKAGGPSTPKTASSISKAKGAKSALIGPSAGVAARLNKAAAAATASSLAPSRSVGASSTTAPKPAAPNGKIGAPAVTSTKAIVGHAPSVARSTKLATTTAGKATPAPTKAATRPKQDIGPAKVTASSAPKSAPAAAAAAKRAAKPPAPSAALEARRKVNPAASTGARGEAVKQPTHSGTSKPVAPAVVAKGARQPPPPPPPPRKVVQPVRGAPSVAKRPAQRTDANKAASMSKWPVGGGSATSTTTSTTARPASKAAAAASLAKAGADGKISSHASDPKPKPQAPGAPSGRPGGKPGAEATATTTKTEEPSPWTSPATLKRATSKQMTPHRLGELEAFKRALVATYGPGALTLPTEPAPQMLEAGAGQEERVVGAPEAGAGEGEGPTPGDDERGGDAAVGERRGPSPIQETREVPASELASGPDEAAPSDQPERHEGDVEIGEGEASSTRADIAQPELAPTAQDAPKPSAPQESAEEIDVATPTVGQEAVETLPALAENPAPHAESAPSEEQAAVGSVLDEAHSSMEDVAEVDGAPAAEAETQPGPTADRGQDGLPADADHQTEDHSTQFPAVEDPTSEEHEAVQETTEQSATEGHSGHDATAAADPVSPTSGLDDAKEEAPAPELPSLEADKLQGTLPPIDSPPVAATTATASHDRSRRASRPIAPATPSAAAQNSPLPSPRNPTRTPLATVNANSPRRAERGMKSPRKSSPLKLGAAAAPSPSVAVPSQGRGSEDVCAPADSVQDGDGFECEAEEDEEEEDEEEEELPDDTVAQVAPSSSSPHKTVPMMRTLPSAVAKIHRRTSLCAQSGCADDDDVTASSASASDAGDAAADDQAKDDDFEARSGATTTSTRLLRNGRGYQLVCGGG